MSVTRKVRSISNALERKLHKTKGPKKMRFVLLSIIFLVPISAKADEPRGNFVFRSSNGQYELRQISSQFDQQQWSLIDKVTGSTRYQIKAQLSSMTVLVSDNGSTLVAVDDYSERKPSKGVDVLLFYRDGKQIKKYLLGELLNDESNISRSVSHFSWLFDPRLLSISDSKLNLTTYELIHYSFDIEMGNVLKKERDSALSDDALYVYGMVKNLGKGRYQMEVCHLVQGVVPKAGEVEFEADRDDRFHTNHYYTVIVKHGRFATEKDVILNSCNYQKKKPSKRREPNHSFNWSANSITFNRET